MNNDVNKLFEIIKTLIGADVLEAEFEECIYNISEDPNTEITVAELNEYFEESMTYWPEG